MWFSIYVRKIFKPINTNGRKKRGVKGSKVSILHLNCLMLIPIDCDKLHIYNLILRVTTKVTQRDILENTTDKTKLNSKNKTFKIRSTFMELST